MGFKSQFAADLDKTNKGVWITLGKTKDDKEIRMRIASMDNGNQAYSTAVHEINREFASVNGEREANHEEAKEMTRKVVAETVVTEWENVQDEAGLAIKCTPENVYDIISDPTLYRVYKRILIAAGEQTRFDPAKVAGEAKN